MFYVVVSDEQCLWEPSYELFVTMHPAFLKNLQARIIIHCAEQFAMCIKFSAFVIYVVESFLWCAQVELWRAFT